MGWAMTSTYEWMQVSANDHAQFEYTTEKIEWFDSSSPAMTPIAMTAYLGLVWHDLFSFTALQLSSRKIMTEYGESKNGLTSVFWMFDRTLYTIV